MKKHLPIIKLSLLTLGLFSGTAQAHFPLMSCWFESDKVACEMATAMAVQQLITTLTCTITTIILLQKLTRINAR